MYINFANVAPIQTQISQNVLTFTSQPTDLTCCRRTHKLIKEGIDKIFPMYPENSRAILAEGVLEKRSSWNNTWQPRFFVLDARGRLCYFKSESDRYFPERASCSLAIDFDSAITVGTGPDRHRYIIKVKAKDAMDRRRTLALGFQEPSDFDRWLEVLSDTQRRVCYVSSRALMTK